MLQVGLATVNRDISYLRNQAKTNIKRYIDERLPEEYEKCLVGLNEKDAAGSNTKTDIHVIIEEERQQQDNNKSEQKSDNNTTTATINQLKLLWSTIC